MKVLCITSSFTDFSFLALFSFFLNFYLFMIVTEREREGGRDTGRGRSRLHAPGARCGIRSRVSGNTPWAKGRRQTAVPPRDPPNTFFFYLFMIVTERERGRDTGRGWSRLHVGARCGTWSRDSRITPWAKGRCTTSEPPRHPSLWWIFLLLILSQHFQIKTLSSLIYFFF